jgi:hypothetical protein
MTTPHHYEITIRGRLSAALLSAFADLAARPVASNTVLSGRIDDQAALYGVLERIESLGLELLDVRSNPTAR